MPVETVSFQELPALKLTNSVKDEAVICFHGAHVVSWKPKDKEEQLYLSPLAQFSEGTAIRGGIPICFPQFAGFGSLPAHGFARNRTWNYLRTEEQGNSVSVFLVLEDDSASRVSAWPYKFRTVLCVTLSEHLLSATLDITNTGSEPFSFTCALHTYFQIRTINHTAIQGLTGHEYDDKVTQQSGLTETTKELFFDHEIDRIYSNTLGTITLQEDKHILKIRGINMPDTVIWNPWIERSKAISDLPDDGYQSMVCIESGMIKTPVILKQSENWQGGQEISILE